LQGISRGHRGGVLGMATFCEPENNLIKTRFNNQYYPATITDGCVKNTLDMDKNVIITGVNASGKTTTLKTAALNIIFSQQFGFGFYESCELSPYSHIHSYLNIPDTSGRDSLFQAESRRCKEILDKIRQTPKTEIHFCIFDELYSGTNPKEAEKSAYGILKFLSKKENVKFALTTHYVNVCSKFRKSEYVNNYKMEVKTNSDGEFIYTYKLLEGISKIEGGIAILRNMDYPAEILDAISGRKDVISGRKDIRS
jgi:DNA mismatch repair ATPase MutS